MTTINEYLCLGVIREQKLQSKDQELLPEEVKLYFGRMFSDGQVILINSVGRLQIRQYDEFTAEQQQYYGI